MNFTLLKNEKAVTLHRNLGLTVPENIETIFFNHNLITTIMKKFLLTLAVAILGVVSAWAETWTAPPTGTYESQTPIYLRPYVDGVELTNAASGTITFGAFIDGECRAVSSTITPAATTQGYMVELNVQGNLQGDNSDLGKPIEIRVQYDGQTYYFNTNSQANSFLFTGEMYRWPQILDLKTISQIETLEFLRVTSYGLTTGDNEYATITDINLFVGLSEDLRKDLYLKYVDGEYVQLESAYCYPEITFTNVNNSADIQLDGPMVTAVNSTVVAGSPIKASLVKNGATLQASVTIHPSYMIDKIELDEKYEVEKGKTINLMEKATFKVWKGNDLVSLKATEFCAPAIEWAFADTTTYRASIDSKTGVVTGLLSTDIHGVPVRGIAEVAGWNPLTVGTSVCVTPYAYSVSEIMFDPAVIETEVGTEIDLYDYLQFLVYVGGNDNVFKKASEFCAPAVTFAVDETIATIEGHKLTAKKGTKLTGTMLKAMVVKNQQTYWSDLSCEATLKVTPYDYELKIVRFKNKEYDVAKGNSIDLSGEVEYGYLTTLEATDITWMTYDMIDDLYKPEVKFRTVNSDATEISVTEAGVVSGLESTDINGIAVAVAVKGLRDSFMTRVRVTPLKYEVIGIKLPESLGSIEVGQTIDLLDKILFVVKTGGYDLTQQPNTAELKASEFANAPAVNWYVDSKFATIAGNVLTAVGGTTIDGTELQASLGDFSEQYPFASSTLIITPYNYEIIELKAEQTEFTLDLNETVDLRSQLKFTLKVGYNEDGSPKTEVKTYAELTNKPALAWISNDYAPINTETGVLTAAQSTGPEGTGSYVVCNDCTGQPNTVNYKIKVVPFYYENLLNVRLAETSDPFELSVEQTRDVLPYLEFLVSDNEWVSSSNVAPATYANFVYTSADESVFTTNGSNLTGVSANEQGIYLVISRYAGDNHPFKVRIVVHAKAVPLTGLSAENVVMVAGETKTVVLTLIPENADFDPANIEVSVSGSSHAISGNWEVVDLSEVKLQNGKWTIDVKANIADKSTVTLSYYPEEGDVIDGNFEVLAGLKHHVNAGWNWVSQLMVDTEMLTPQLLRENKYKVIDMRSQTQVTYYDAQYETFFGSLASLTNAAYRVKSEETKGFVVYPENTTTSVAYGNVTIYKGWTWLYYPYQINISLADICDQFENLNLTDGDKIISKDKGFVEYNDGKWSDDSFVFEAGQSYLLYCKNGGTLSWTEESMLPGADLMGSQPTASAAPSARPSSVWQYDASQFQQNMVIVATLEDMDTELGAFVEGECRGEAKRVEIDGQTYYFITVHGNPGETVNFRTYEGGQYGAVETAITFTGMAGTVKAPVILKPGVVTGIQSIDAESAAAAQYDLQGRRVNAAGGLHIESRNGVARKVIK